MYPAPDINEDLAACFVSPCNDDEELPKHIRRYDNDKVSTILHRVRRKKKKDETNTPQHNLKKSLGY